MTPRPTAEQEAAHRAEYERLRDAADGWTPHAFRTLQEIHDERARDDLIAAREQVRRTRRERELREAEPDYRSMLLLQRIAADVRRIADALDA